MRPRDPEQCSCTAAVRTLEHIAHEEDAKGAVVVQWDYVQHIDCHNTDEHLNETQVSRAPRAIGERHAPSGRSKFAKAGKSIKNFAIKRTDRRTRNAQAGVNVLRSCGLLYHTINIEKHTRSAKTT